MGIIFLSQLLKSLGLLSNNQEKISKGKKNPMECFHSEGIVAKMLMQTPPGSTISPCRVQLPGVSHFAFVSLSIGQRRDDGMNVTRPYWALLWPQQGYREEGIEGDRWATPAPPAVPALFLTFRVSCSRMAPTRAVPSGATSWDQMMVIWEIGFIGLRNLLSMVEPAS